MTDRQKQWTGIAVAAVLELAAFWALFTFAPSIDNAKQPDNGRKQRNEETQKQIQDVKERRLENESDKKALSPDS